MGGPCSAQVLSVDPGCAPAHFGLGAVCYARGLFGDAVACYQQSLELAPEADLRGEMHHALGLALTQVIDTSRACVLRRVCN